LRLRVEYKKGQEIKYLSHLQLIRLVERVLRRAQIPYALSEGFSPHIKLSLGTVLPVGVWGVREYFDLELTREIPPGQFMEAVNRVAPTGFEVRQAKIISDKAPSLQAQVNAAVYCLVLKPGVEEERARTTLEDVMRGEKLMVPKRGSATEEKDLRPGIYRLSLGKEEGVLVILALVSSGSKDNIRPDELVLCLEDRGLAGAFADVYRMANYWRQPDGSLSSPLDLEKV